MASFSRYKVIITAMVVGLAVYNVWLTVAVWTGSLTSAAENQRTTEHPQRISSTSLSLNTTALHSRPSFTAHAQSSKKQAIRRATTAISPPQPTSSSPSLSLTSPSSAAHAQTRRAIKGKSFNLCGAHQGNPDGNYSHPNIVHYVKLTEGATAQLHFPDYLSMLSARVFFNPDTIFLHSNVPPTGTYWDQVERELAVQYHHVDRPGTLERGKKTAWIQHDADYIKLDMVLKMGGIATDFDVIFLNSSQYREEQRRGECVLSSEEGCRNLNAGFFSCVKNSKFVWQWRAGYFLDYRPEGWVYNCASYPLKIMRENPGSYDIVIDRTVAEEPSWSLRSAWYDKTKRVNWRSKSAAHYFSRGRSIPGFFGKHSLTLTSSVGDMFRHVYHSAIYATKLQHP